MKFCKDCSYCYLKDFGEGITDFKCNHPKAKYISTNFVQGGDEVKYYYCDTMRLSISSCGPDGNLWEKKND